MNSTLSSSAVLSPPAIFDLWLHVVCWYFGWWRTKCGARYEDVLITTRTLVYSTVLLLDLRGVHTSYFELFQNFPRANKVAHKTQKKIQIQMIHLQSSSSKTQIHSTLINHVIPSLRRNPKVSHTSIKTPTVTCLARASQRKEVKEVPTVYTSMDHKFISCPWKKPPACCPTTYLSIRISNALEQEVRSTNRCLFEFENCLIDMNI